MSGLIATIDWLLHVLEGGEVVNVAGAADVRVLGLSWSVSSSESAPGRGNAGVSGIAALISVSTEERRRSMRSGTEERVRQHVFQHTHTEVGPRDWIPVVEERLGW